MFKNYGEIDDSAINFVQCFRLTKRWKTHNNDRAIMSGKLSQLYYEIGVRRKASMMVTKTLYRELEEYSNETYVLVYRTPRFRRKWEYFIPFGKVIEVTIYVTYRERNRIRIRQLEIRIIASIPIHWKIKDIDPNIFINIAKSYLYDMEIMFYDIASYGIKTGFRYLTFDQLPQELKDFMIQNKFYPYEWCNKVARLVLFMGYIEIYDIDYNRLIAEDMLFDIGRDWLL